MILSILKSPKMFVFVHMCVYNSYFNPTSITGMGMYVCTPMSYFNYPRSLLTVFTAICWSKNVDNKVVGI